MSKVLNAIVTGAAETAGYYNILPTFFVNSVEAVAIHRDEFANGETVDIIEIEGQYGIAKQSNNMRGVLSVPSSLHQGIYSDAPYSVAASFIGQKVNRLKSFYRRAKVLNVSASKIGLQYLDGLDITSDQSNELGVAPVAGLVVAGFSVDDVILVNTWEYNQPMVCGWWQPGDLQMGSVKCQPYFAAGLTIGGRILIAHNDRAMNAEVISEIESWTGIKKYSTEFYGVAAVNNKGKVFYSSAGDGTGGGIVEYFSAAVDMWSNIIDVGINLRAIAGVRADGRVNIARIFETGLGVINFESLTLTFSKPIKRVFASRRFDNLILGHCFLFITEDNYGFRVSISNTEPQSWAEDDMTANVVWGDSCSDVMNVFVLSDGTVKYLHSGHSADPDYIPTPIIPAEPDVIKVSIDGHFLGDVMFLHKNGLVRRYTTNAAFALQITMAGLIDLEKSPTYYFGLQSDGKIKVANDFLAGPAGEPATATADWNLKT